MPPRLTPNGLYICSRQDLEQFLEETYTVLLDRLGTSLSEQEEQGMHRDMRRALDVWHTDAQQLPILRQEDL